MHLYFSSLDERPRAQEHLLQISTSGRTPLPAAWIEANQGRAPCVIHMSLFGGVLLGSRVGSLALTFQLPLGPGMRVGALEAQELAAQGTLGAAGAWPWRLSSVAHADLQVECSLSNTMLDPSLASSHLKAEAFPPYKPTPSWSSRPSLGHLPLGSPPGSQGHSAAHILQDFLDMSPSLW